MDNQLKRYTLQGCVHAINIYNYPKEHTTRQRLLGYRYMLSERCQYFPAKTKIVDNMKMFFEQCIANINTQNYANEIVDILLEYEPRQGQILLERLRNIQENVIREERPPIAIYTPIPTQTKKSTKTIYTDTQNVHDKTINNNVKLACCKIVNDFINTEEFEKISSDDIGQRLYEKFNNQKIYDIVKHIKEDIANFNCNISLDEVLRCVWLYIQSHPNSDDMEYRLYQEMIEMDGLCATGHLARIINSIQGYTSEYTVLMSEEEQIKAVVKHYLSEKLKKCDNEVILDGISEGSIGFKVFIKNCISEMIHVWVKDYGKQIVHYIPNIVNEFANCTVYPLSV